jgi:hypothetical protein
VQPDIRISRVDTQELLASVSAWVFRHEDGNGKTSIHQCREQSPPTGNLGPSSLHRLLARDTAANDRLLEAPPVPARIQERSQSINMSAGPTMCRINARRRAVTSSSSCPGSYAKSPMSTS